MPFLPRPSPGLPAADETVEAGGSLGSSQHLKSSFKLLAQPLKPFAKHFPLGFLTLGKCYLSVSNSFMLSSSKCHFIRAV